MRQQTALSIVAAWTAMCVATAANSGAPASEMAGMKMSGMSMAAEGQPGEPTRQAYTSNHAFLVKLHSIPRPVPFEKYFAIKLAVYDGRHPTKLLPDAHLSITAGMRHGLKHGFAHGMQSTARVQASGGVYTVSGLYFHMAGPWTLEVNVERAGQKGTAYLTLPCCGQ